MTGSSSAPIVIPIVVVISLAAWILMVYHADGHGRISCPSDRLWFPSRIALVLT
jgi:hypothetical protein